MKQPLFSVVIPIYNVEDYLEEALLSVINQSIGIKNIEIILVNDGSPDNSEQICLKYKEKYPDNIKYIKQANGGVSSARNNGLKHATGKYISFLDSDDKWDKNAFKKAYEMFEQNDDIDVIACIIEYFEARTGFSHHLNFKFTSDRIIDIQEEPESIQMHMASCIMRRNAIGDTVFNQNLKYGEDSLFINEIIIKKGKYGLLKSVSYYYRKRISENSAMDMAWTKKDYYEKTLKNLHDNLIEISKEKYGKLIPYMQYLTIYDIQWRIKKAPLPGILTDEETQEYIDHIKRIIKLIDDDIIINQKVLLPENKWYALSIKDDNDIYSNIKLIDKDLYYKDIKFLNLSSTKSIITISVININEDEATFVGEVDFPFASEDYKIVMKINDTYKELELHDLKRSSKKSMEGIMYYCLSFDCSFKLNKKRNNVINFYIKYKDNDLIKLSPNYNINSHLSAGIHSHYRKDDYMLYSQGKSTIIRKHSYLKSLKQEILLLLQASRRGLFKIAIVRILYYLLRIFNRKDIWIVSDRKQVANDNGMHMFKYITKEQPKDVKVCFAISKKAEDYEKMKQYGKVLNFDSFIYKLYFLLSSKIISSQADNYYTNAFGKSNIWYRDLYRHDFIFLQHGITKDDISDWLNIESKNIRIFVTAARQEYESILGIRYGYDKNVVKLTGFPRFDNLYDESQKIVAIMPTWRQNLSGESKNGVRLYNPKFKESDYFNFYNRLINDKKVLGAMRKKGYKGIFVIHPSHQENHIDFEGNDIFSVVEGFADYQTIFREANLLVSDYSSVPFDFAYLGKPIIYTQFDREEFFKSHLYQEGYFSYENDGFGPVVYNYNDTVDAIVKSINSDCKNDKKYLDRANSFYKYRDRNNCERVYEEIRKIK